MSGSGCEILHKESGRFVGFVLADPRIRRQIVDEDSLVDAVRKSFSSDKSNQFLGNIIKDIDGSGLDLKNCLSDVIASSEIQGLIRNNVKTRMKEIRNRVKQQKPSLTGRNLTKEVNKRLKLSLAGTKSQVKKLKQVTIAEAIRPVKVGEYRRQGKKVKAYSKTNPRSLTNAEKMLIRNNINKTPQEVVDIYLKSGLKYRSPESIRKHYRRIKIKI